MDIGETEVAAGMAESELLVVQPQKVEDGGMEVVDVDGIFLGFEPKLVRGTVDRARLDAAASHPHRKAVVVVVASIDLALVGAGSRKLDGWCTPKFSAPDDERVLEHAALFEVGKEGCRPLIAIQRELAVVLFEIIVGIPRLARRMPDLDHAHPPLGEASGQQALAAVGRVAVHVADVLRLFFEVKRVGGLNLHPVRQFEGLNAGLDLRVALTFRLMPQVKAAQKIELGALLGLAPRGVTNVFDELVDIRVFRVDVGALQHTGEECGLPVGGSSGGIAAWAKRDEARQVLVLAAQAVRDPRPHAGAGETRFPAVHEQEGRLMVGYVGVHGADDHQVVRALGDIGKDVTDFDPALAVFCKGKRGAEGCASGALGFQMARGQRLAVEPGQFGLGIKRIQVGRSAIGKKMDDAFSAAWKVRGAGRKRRAADHGSLRGIGESSESEHAEPHSASRQKGPA